MHNSSVSISDNIKMDSNNGLHVIFSNFGPNRDNEIQDSNSETLQEVCDYFESNPATPVKDIETPIKAKYIVGVATNLNEIFETIEVVEENTIVLESSSLVIPNDKANDDKVSREEEGSIKSNESNIGEEIYQTW